VTWNEAYTSLLRLYKRLMFPNNQTGWTMSQIDEMDVHFFNDLMDLEETEQEQDVYLSEVW